MKIGDMLKVTGFKDQSLITVESNEFVSVAVRKLVQYDKGALPVCNEKNELIGIITERDIVRKCCTQIADFEKKKVGDIMTHKVAFVTLDDDLDYAVSTMKKEKIRHLPIVQGKSAIGILSMRDVLGFQYEENKAEIKYIQLLPKRPLYK